MNQSKNKQLVTFDLGGVVVRVAGSIDEAARRAGVRLSEPGPTLDHVRLRDLLDTWQIGTISDEDFFAQWSLLHGYRFSRTDAEAISASFLVEQYEGLNEITEELKGQGIEMGCLSNTSNHHWEVMNEDSKKFPSVSSFVHPHASHLWGVMKPKDRIYELYEEATGYAPADIVFFDDLAENVEAAKKRGWKAYRIMSNTEPSVQIREALSALGIYP